ncbi:MAG: KTSC domain-containing protein [Alphaproteobacteria bacterium]|nr:KTSC domain-containing protein [Alphaproteobacteria bacterium]MBV9063720.1 KTSC domain-containing protein [Alphaproteobacteria bacterium]
MDHAEFPGSTAVIFGAYDRKARVLYLCYRDNIRTYRYKRVPPQEWGNLLNASSKGTYVNQYIKPLYEYDEVSAPELEAV